MRILQFLYFVAFAVTFCYGSINSDTKKFGYSKGVNFKGDPAICSLKASCEPILHNTTCFGTVLPYHLTSVALAEDSITQFDVQDNLAMLEGLKSIPRCWAVVQPLLCAIYMPKCENDSVFLPSQEMCRITRGPCMFVENIHGWPSFLRCDNKKLFPPRCANPLKEIKFNTTSKCMAPLTETDYEENWFYEVEGCGLQCQDPFFSKQEHEDFHHYNFILCVVGCTLTAFAVVTFIISRKASNHYPGIIVFYINICLALVNFGYLLQFFPGAREQIVCNSDGTIRRQQPKSEEKLCFFTFILTYYFLLAAWIWFGVLSYSWYIIFRVPGSGTTKQTLKKKGAHFHLAAWCIPLVPTVAILAIKQVDGDSMSGICSVGFSDMYMRLGFWLVLMIAAKFVIFAFIVLVLNILIRVKLKSREMTDERRRKVMINVLLRIGLSSIGLLFITISETACYAYDFAYRNEWMESLRDYIVCKAMHSAQPYSGEPPKCLLKSKPSMSLLILQQICLCLLSIIMFSWVMRKASITSWKQFLYRLCSPSERNANTIKKHELISKAFQRRHQINQGRFSLSLNSTHDDPVGMNLDLNSVASREISSSWAMALPQFIMRRNAVTGLVPFGSRLYSSASDISRHISDSYNQQNLELSEQDYANVLRHQRRKTKKERERFMRASRIALYTGNRRDSDTSLQSSLMTASIVAAAAKSLGDQVTKSTSTGDLGIQAAIQAAAAFGMPHLIPPEDLSAANMLPRNMIQREKEILPFMHGMDGSCGLDPGQDPQGDTRTIRSSVRSSHQRVPLFPPGGFPNTVNGVVPPMFRSEYDMMNIPLWYLGGGMYPPNLYAAGYNYAAFGAAPHLAFGQGADAIYQNSLIPLQPRVDSASEGEYFPIVMSDSEYTDTGLRSYDEAQLLSACLMQQERLQAQAILAASAEPHQPKPALEPQACAKTQFLKRINSKVIAPPTSRPASGKKTPHSEAPPPSPAESMKSIEMGDLDLF